MDKQATIKYLQSMRREMKEAERPAEAEALRTAMDELESKEEWANIFPLEDDGHWEKGDEWYHRLRLLWYQMRIAACRGQEGPEGVAEWYRTVYGEKAAEILTILQKEAELFTSAIMDHLNPAEKDIPS